MLRSLNQWRIRSQTLAAVAGGRLASREGVRDGCERALEACVVMLSGLHMGDQSCHGVDVAAPETLAIPPCFHSGGTATTEDIGHELNVDAMLLGVVQGLGGDECGELGWIRMDSVDRILFPVAEIPIGR